jgi:hypothetical protein
MKRFWDKVCKSSDPNGCWIWTGSKTRDGYGQFKLDGKVLRAHQVSWKLHNLKYATYLCHTCHNTSCVNPAHLYEGNHESNMRDKANRGLRWSKYDEHLVRRIRRMYFVGFSSNDISEKFQINKRTVLYILNGDMCKDMGGPIRDKNFRYYGNRFKRGIRKSSKSVS